MSECIRVAAGKRGTRTKLSSSPFASWSQWASQLPLFQGWNLLSFNVSVTFRHYFTAPPLQRESKERRVKWEEGGGHTHAHTCSFLDPPSTSLDLTSLTHICHLNFPTHGLLSKQQTFKNSDLGSVFTGRQPHILWMNFCCFSSHTARAVMQMASRSGPRHVNVLLHRVWVLTSIEVL